MRQMLPWGFVSSEIPARKWSWQHCAQAQPLTEPDAEDPWWHWRRSHSHIRIQKTLADPRIGRLAERDNTGSRAGRDVPDVPCAGSCWAHARESSWQGLAVWCGIVCSGWKLIFSSPFPPHPGGYGEVVLVATLSQHEELICARCAGILILVWRAAPSAFPRQSSSSGRRRWHC